MENVSTVTNGDSSTGAEAGIGLGGAAGGCGLRGFGATLTVI